MANCDKDRRVLDVYYTEKGTKLFVENGVLVEETIKSSPSSHLGIHNGRSFTGMMASCKSYSYDPPAKKPPMSEEENSRVMKLLNERTIMLAKTALEYYNGRNRTKYKYELVDPVVSSCIMQSGIWHHCNFTATNAISPESSKEGPKLFFAELKIVRLKNGSHKHFVTACHAIDGAKTVRGCDVCEDCIQHPTHGFFQGLRNSKTRTLRPRSNGKVARKF